MGRAVAVRRIQSELRDWLASPPEGCRLAGEPAEPLKEWLVDMDGPETSPVEPPLYAGQTFRLRVRFTERYPLEPPEFVFVPPAVPVHHHTYSNGHLCVSICYDGANGDWSPALTVAKVALSLRSMLASATEAKRPPGDAEYCARVRGRSPKNTQWLFDDDKV